MRRLNHQFMSDLEGSKFNEIIKLIKRDSSLEFQIRKDQVHIYYRGGKIWDIKQEHKKYKAFFDEKYSKNGKYSKKIKALPPVLLSDDEVTQWIETVPFLKQAMDEYFLSNEKSERDYQQHVVKENNHLKVANGTDYFIVDIEYASSGFRADMAAICWSSDGTSRKALKNYEPTLAFIEMKFGDGQLSGKSGIKEHITHIDNFLSKTENYQRIREEFKIIFQQKRKLGLIKSIRHNKNEIKELSSDKPEFILLLAAHDPESKTLLEILSQLTPMKHAKLKIATANFMGYALYRQGILDIEEFQRKFPNQLYTKS